MKNTIKPARRMRRQRGFSILEILIATVLISSLVASGLYYANVGDKAATADTAAAKAAIAVRFPEAIMTIYSLKETLTGTTAQQLVNTGSVQSGQPVTWAVATSPAPTADSISINLTFADDATAAAMATYLTANQNNMLVSSASADKKVLTVAYSLN